MNFASVEAIADAVLFEGYILYPYRPSSLKNRQRWNFGTLYPRSFAETQLPQERCQFSVQVLVETKENARVSARVRFLELRGPREECSEGWEQGIQRSRTLEGLTLAELVTGVERSLDFSEVSSDECASNSIGVYPGARVGRLHCCAEPLREGLCRLSVSFSNESPLPAFEALSRRLVQGIAFTSTHLLLGVENGSFVSLLDPDVEFAEQVKSCVQDGVFPVIAGEAGDRSVMLCSPIILYDYPQVAPESAGNFFDSTEMDEMLALRVLTLTDEEKDEMRRSDPHARQILERTETLSDEQLARVHGAVRGVRLVAKQDRISAAAQLDIIEQPFNPFAEHKPVESVRVFGVNVGPGHRVRLWPQKKADILDMEMEGKIAIIEAIEQDLENQVQFAVVLEDDPGKDIGMLRQTGHRFFFSPEEIEPLGLEGA
jgi:hypothetical protein